MISERAWDTTSPYSLKKTTQKMTVTGREKIKPERVRITLSCSSGISVL
jgi:hypothetical protein